MKKIKTSAVMRAIVADKEATGEQREYASSVLRRMGEGPRTPTWNRLFDCFPFSLRRAAGVPYAEEEFDVMRKRVHDALVKLAAHYGIQPTEET